MYFEELFDLENEQPPPLSPIIQFIIPVEDDNPYEASMTQGFAPSLLRNANLVRLTAFFPSNIHDLSNEGRKLYGVARMGGANPIRWYPQSPKTLKALVIPPTFAFTVLLLGQEHHIEDYSDWLAAHTFPLTVVSEKGGTFNYVEFSVEKLGKHFLNICNSLEGKVESKSIQNAKKALLQWQPLKERDLGYQVQGHNSVTPNLMALSAMGFEDPVSGPFRAIGAKDGIDVYIEQIVKTSRSILEDRETIGIRRAHEMFRCPPEINLFAPSIYPHFFEMEIPSELALTDEGRKLQLVRSVLKNQKGYKFELTPSQASAAVDFDETTRELNPHFVIRQRAEELSFGSNCMGTLAASEFSLVLRLPNDVNRTSGQVRQFADHYRGQNTSEKKRCLAFRKVQKQITQSVPVGFIDFIKSAEHGVRIVSDAHLEWINLDGIPLCLAKDTSRIPVTPGNLFVSQVTANTALHLVPQAFEEVLIVSALSRGDPIKPFFDVAIEQFSPLWREKIKVKHVEVSTEEQFVEALNKHEGVFVIFDGHGSHEQNHPGQLYLMDTAVDVWQLRKRIKRPPPIVLLSACDTHAADRNHATVGNGFLALGSRAVISSVFPLNAYDACVFAARLLYRISSFVPAAFKTFNRSLTWLEIVSGMLRMQLLTDFMRLLERKNIINRETSKKINIFGNMAINSLSENPFDAIIDCVNQETKRSKSELRSLFQIAVAHSSTISYRHLGRPETIMLHPSANDEFDRKENSYD